MVCVRVRVGAEEYALAVERVLEAAELGDVTTVPGSPGYVRGVRNLRGQIMAIVDLATVLGIEREGDDPPARLVVVEDGSRRAGLAVDAILDVAPLPDATEPTDTPLLDGAVLIDGALIGVLDVPAVLAATTTATAA